MKKLELHGKYGEGKFALVDDDDFEQLNQWRWHLGSKGYVRRSIRISVGKQSSIFLHKQIVSTPKGLVTDHIDNNKLNNQKNNLRVCTNLQNARNCSLRRDSTSGYKGVQYRPTYYFNKKLYKSKNPWVARVRIYRKTLLNRRFATKEEAALIYNQITLRFFGEFAKLNDIIL